MNTTPLEEEEQATLVEWMEYQGVKFTAIPNSTFTKSWKQKKKNTEQGLRAGFPDLVVIIPKDKSKTGKNELIFIEMKRTKGGAVSESQKEWIEALTECDQEVFICKGFDEAEEVLSQYLL